MNSIRQIQQLNRRELEAGVSSSASWHVDYRDTAFVYVGGLPLGLTEGDVVTICSQYGEPTYVNVVRDKETGKSKGFAFLKYADQRSTDLAVDNLGGATVLGRILKVDHTRYKPKDDEDIFDNTYGEGGPPIEAAATDVEASDDEPKRPLLPEERELQRLQREHDDDDPMKRYMVDEQKQKVAEAISQWERKEGSKSRHGHGERRRRRGGDGKDADGERRHKHRHRQRSEHSERQDESSRRRDQDSRERHRRRDS